MWTRDVSNTPTWPQNRGLSLAEIARRVGKNKSTISRELRRNANIVTAEDRLFWMKVRNLWFDDDLERYLTRDAQARRDFRRWESNQKRRRKRPETRRWVVQKLKLHWSPQQIAGRSRIEAPEPVSHEYVYSMLYRDKKRGGRLYRLLKRFRKRKQRFGARTYPSGPVIPNRVGIEERPAIVDSRSRLGDCEGDLIVGYRQSGYVLSLIDRKSRYVTLRKLKTKRKRTVRVQLERAMRKMRHARTLTLDNVYFATPYRSTDRASNENTNGLIRRYLPKKTSFLRLRQSRLNEIERSLNHRPRACLGYLTPHEVHFNKRPRIFPKT